MIPLSLILTLALPKLLVRERLLEAPLLLLLLLAWLELLEELLELLRVAPVEEANTLLRTKDRAAVLVVLSLNAAVIFLVLETDPCGLAELVFLLVLVPDKVIREFGPVEQLPDELPSTPALAAASRNRDLITRQLLGLRVNEDLLQYKIDTYKHILNYNNFNLYHIIIHPSEINNKLTFNISYRPR